ncbi:Hypothetical predicted protein [Mytilus galloprovincialis]|uniref:Uncharacterized protein n=1 Tax=Mytilus galloprovincialis TaxID=29158 RepID=A0A8B6CTM5_MYTGA|nr:Hypothetical predicted protein [Mytilus galloprovincialis]
MWENYVLAYYPMLATSVLIIALGIMLFSTIYIITSLCNRKGIRRRSTISVNEKRSCVLTVILMVVFLLSEIPRVYINTALFNTFKSNIGQKDVVWNQIKTTMERDSLLCFDYETEKFRKSTELTFNYSIIFEKEQEEESNLCGPYNMTGIISESDLKWLFNVLELSFKQDTDVMSLLMKKVYLEIYDVYKDNLNSNQKEMFKQLLDKISNTTMEPVQTLISYVFKTFKVAICYSLFYKFGFTKWMSGQLADYLISCTNCMIKHMTSSFLNLPALTLSSTPYSEPMNYILTIIWGRVDITLDGLKVLIEILKLFTVLACASNFMIYIAMSEKMRNLLLKKLLFWRGQSESITTGENSSS